MAALHQRYEMDSPDPEAGLATIRAARHQVEAEACAQLEEQAQWRLAAQTRAVPAEQLQQSRQDDLQRLEGQHRQAEREAIAAIERRMEVALRAIEADNTRIMEEERASILATERMALARQAMQQARERQQAEQRLAEQIRQRQALEQQAQQLAQERATAEQALMQKTRERQVREQQLKLALDEAHHEAQWALLALDWEAERLRLTQRQRWLWTVLGLVSLGWLVTLWLTHGGSI